MNDKLFKKLIVYSFSLIIVFGGMGKLALQTKKETDRIMKVRETRLIHKQDLEHKKFLRIFILRKNNE